MNRFRFGLILMESCLFPIGEVSSKLVIGTNQMESLLIETKDFFVWHPFGNEWAWPSDNVTAPKMLELSTTDGTFISARDPFNFKIPVPEPLDPRYTVWSPGSGGLWAPSYSRDTEPNRRGDLHLSNDTDATTGQPIFYIASMDSLWASNQGGDIKKLGDFGVAVSLPIRNFGQRPLTSLAYELPPVVPATGNCTDRIDNNGNGKCDTTEEGLIPHRSVDLGVIIGDGGGAAFDVTVTADDGVSPNPPIDFAEGTIVHWSTTPPANNCEYTVNNGAPSSVGASGSVATGPLFRDTTYEFSCNLSGDIKTDLVIIRVNAPPPLQCIP